MGVTRAAEALAVLAVAALLLAPFPSAQDTSCATKLVDCAGDINSTAKPSEKCCSSIKEAVDTQLSCLCSLLRNKDLIKNFISNITQALELPKRCGIDKSTDICDSIPSPASPPGGSSGTPPGNSSSSATDNNRSGSARATTWIGTSGLMGLLVLSWSIVA